jgi:flagellar biosynthesis/type III secretory pathway protein FliH
MQGFTPFDGRHLRRAPAPPRRAGLSLPDFDAPPPPPEPEGPTLEQQLEAAFAAGREAGLAEGRELGMQEALRRAEQRMSDSVGVLSAHLEASRAEARALADHAVGELAALVLRVLDAAAPLAATRAAPDAIARLAAELHPLLADAPEATLFVAPTLVEAMALRVGGIPVAGDPALPESDARIAWRDGDVALDFAARQRAIREALASQGLIEMEQDA